MEDFKINIEFTSDLRKPPMVTREINGVKQSFYTDWDQIIAGLKGSFILENIKKDQENMKTEWVTPALPKGAVRYIKKLSKLGNSMEELVAVEVEAGKHDIDYCNTLMKGVAFPKLLFVFTVLTKDTAKPNEKTLGKTYVYALKSTSLYTRDDTVLCNYPFAHVFSGGDACWHEKPALRDLVQLTTMPNLFFASPDSGHAYNGNGQGRNLSGCVYRQLLETCCELEAFPDDWLLPTNLTFGKWLENNFGLSGNEINPEDPVLSETEQTSEEFDEEYYDNEEFENTDVA